ncbi:MAG: MFS transporter [Pseudomonadota bacterium]
MGGSEKTKTEPAPDAADQGVHCPPDRRRYVLAAAVLGSSMAFIDGTAVTLALPAIQKELGASLSDMLWVTNAYTLFLAALILVGGAFGDLFGRRRIFVLGIAIFAAASLVCAVAPDPMTLIAARGLQGVGAALLTPLSLALLSAAYPKDKRGGAIGAWAAASALMTALGPPLGGWFAENMSWRWIFLINLPLAVAAIGLTLWRTPQTPPMKREAPIDWLGAVLAVAGLGATAYGLIGWAEAVGVSETGATDAAAHGGGVDWRLSLGAGLACLAAFVVAEFRARAPMAPPQLFLQSRCFTVVNLLTFFLYGALGGIFVFYPFYLIDGHGRGGDEVGLAFLGFAIPMALLSRWSGVLIDKVGARAPVQSLQPP